MTKDSLKELRWLRGLVAEREGHGGDIPVWLALEWIDDAIKRAAAEPTEEPIPPGYRALSDVIAEHEKDPERKARLDRAREQFRFDPASSVEPVSDAQTARHSEAIPRAPARLRPRVLVGRDRDRVLGEGPEA